MTFEIDGCKFHLKAMTSPDYQPLVDNKRIIEKLKERITLMNVELMTEREHNEKIMKNIKGFIDDVCHNLTVDIGIDLKEIEEKRQRENKQKIEEEIHEVRVRQSIL